MTAACFALMVFGAVSTSAGPPAPAPYKAIPDPPDSAERHIVVKEQDRGPVWLLTGLLSTYDGSMSFDTVARLKLSHWRGGDWPFWSPSTIIVKPRPKWDDQRDSAAELGKWLDTVNRLRERGLTWQPVLFHQGPYYGKTRIRSKELKAYYDHTYTLVKYCTHMGTPIDYWEPWNEPQEGPYKGLANPGGFWEGTWQEYLDMWDAGYSAIRKADPAAKIVGPSYGYGHNLKPFLEHCKQKKQRLDVLAWHENLQTFTPPMPIPDAIHQTIEKNRKLVAGEFPMLGVKEIHIDEWGYTLETTGPGTQIAFFYYLDLAGVDRAARSTFTGKLDLDGLLVDPKTPRTSYWAWVAYAEGTGVRLVTETNDRCVVAIASRDDAAKTVRAVVARSKRGADALPPVKTIVEFQGLPLSGKAEVTLLRLGPGDGPLTEQELPALTTKTTMDATGGRLSLTLNALAENEVYSITIAPVSGAR